jgi:magnesium transporter
VNFNAIELYIKKLHSGLTPKKDVEHADVANYLQNIKDEDEKKFFEYLNALPINIKAQTFVRLPSNYLVDIINETTADDLVKILEELESDDATDLYKAIVTTNKIKEDLVFSLLSDKKQEEIEKLIHYSENEAGSLMQTELLKVSLDETINDCLEKLKELKQNGIKMVQYIFVVDKNDKLLNTIAMDDLILENNTDTFDKIIDKYPISHTVMSHDSIQSVLNTIEKYDIASLPVVDKMGHILGIITHDDVIDIIHSQATNQMYGLNKVDQDEKLYDSYATITKSRSSWLFINLINAILASLVIGAFEKTLHEVIALAILLPIVANMAGTASVQTMTVIVRRMALGELGFDNIKPIFIKELNVAIINGVLFAIVSAVVTYLWFSNSLISIAMALSMFVSIVFAGILGTLTPLFLKKMSFDPAVSSAVIVITLVDIIGFFSFLWFSTIIVL